MSNTPSIPPPLFPPEMRDKEAMAVLSKRLADNYFDVTFGYPGRPHTFPENYRKVFRSSVPRNFTQEPRVRNVVVIGAGASYAAFGDHRFPMASAAITRLGESLGVSGLQQALRLTGSGLNSPADRFEELEARHTQLYGIANPKSDFESQLTVLSNFYTLPQIQAALGALYSTRHYPHIIFETIAHLLKHRFVDVVINYNFDEVLDQAIEEELHGGDYRRVISDGDCDVLSKLVIDEQLKVPLYIKPHGTIGHKSTLRFTRDAYITMPSGLLAFTRKILWGDTKEDSSQQRDHYHVNLISVGFAFTSVELIEMLKGHDRLQVFHFNVAGDENEKTLHRNVQEIGKNVPQFFIGIAPAPEAGKEPPVGAYPSIQRAVTDLFTQTVNRFDRKYRPRSLTRHWFVHALLFSTAEVEPGTARPGGAEARKPRPVDCGARVPVRDRYYFLARLYIELTLALAAGNGRIDLSTLVHTRVGTYFREWRDAEPGGGVSLREICVRLNLNHNDGSGGNVFTTHPLTEEEQREKVRRNESKQDPESRMRRTELHLARALGRQLWKSLRTALLEIDDQAFQHHIHSLEPSGTKPDTVGEAAGEHDENKLIDYLAGLVDSDVQELAPRFSPDALLLLNRISPSAVIHTHLGMITRFMELVDETDWDLFLAISEQGKVLRKLKNHLARQEGHPSQIRRRASVIVADAPHPRVMDARMNLYKGDDSIRIGDDYRLPYWAHNDHMVIVLRMGVHPGQFAPLGAISYRKSGLENRVNPLFIEDADDLDLLVNTYFGNVAKAIEYQKGPANGSRPGIPNVDFDLAWDTRRRLFDEWWTQMNAARGPTVDGQADGARPRPSPGRRIG